MLSTLDLDAVNSFFKTCKNEIDKRNCYFVGYRKISINGKVISAKQALIDIGIMKEKDIWNHIKNLEAKKLTDWSHKFKGWIDTKNGEIIDYKYAKYFELEKNW